MAPHQPGLLVQHLNLYIYELDDTVHVFHIEVEHFPPASLDDTGADQ